MPTADRTTPPAPAAALMTLATSQGRWSGFDFHMHTFPILGKVLLCDVKVILQEYQPAEQPELSLLVTWIRTPGRPFQATQAFAFRAAKTLGALIDPGEPQTYSDQVQISPRMAWEMMQTDDPAAWYMALQGGVQDPLPFALV